MDNFCENESTLIPSRGKIRVAVAGIPTNPTELTHSSFLKRASLCCTVVCMIRIFFFFFNKIRLQDEKFASVKSQVTDF